MGRIGTILNIITSIKRDVSVAESVVELTKGENVTIENYRPAGDDSRPLPGDLSFSEVKDGGTGSRAELGYIDQKNAPEALVGEKRLYSRGVDGTIMAVIWLKRDGKIVIKNPSESLGPLVDDLINAVKAIVTTGSPTVHTVNATSKTALDVVKAKFNTLLGV